jgi:hypothetical protein
MPLPLTDPRWNELRSSYNGTEDVVAWLSEAYQEGMSSESLGDLINEVQHQGGTSTAMYAVAPHLVEIARPVSPEDALELLTQAGLIYASAGRSDAVACPAFLREELISCASEGAKLLAPLLLFATDFDTYKWAVAGLAGFMGHDSFARFLDGLELDEGQFHHVRLDQPFPKDI